MILSIIFGGLFKLMVVAIWGIIVFKLSCFLLKKTAPGKE